MNITHDNITYKIFAKYFTPEEAELALTDLAQKMEKELMKSQHIAATRADIQFLDNKIDTKFYFTMGAIGALIPIFFGIFYYMMNVQTENFNKRFEAIDKRFEAIDKRFEAADKKHDELRAEFKEQMTLQRAEFKEQMALQTELILLKIDGKLKNK